MLTSLPYPKYNAHHSYPSAEEYTITCENAVCVYVRANLLEVLAVDHVADNFTAVFTLQFRYKKKKAIDTSSSSNASR